METKKPVFDLEERTARFGEDVIRFCKKIALTPITEPLIRQIVKSGTSVGANYCEADDAVSGKEFRQKIGTCKKESRETKHWLRMLAVAAEEHAGPARVLWREANELMLIFSSIFRKLSTKKLRTK
jgi:four helix bundle protein